MLPAIALYFMFLGTLQLINAGMAVSEENGFLASLQLLLGLLSTGSGVYILATL